ncbi:MAG: mandelate racemase/muconate lactonizing enzyme family protein [Pseudorhodobacter sp.]
MTAPLTRVEILHFRHRLPRAVPTGMGPLRHRPAILLRVEDAEGAHGWGEIWCNFPPDGDLHRARLAGHVLPAALARLTAESEGVFETVRQRLHRLALQAGEPGPVAQIAAGIDIALHDLKARRGGLPLARLLGGSPRDVPAYASGISPDQAGAQAERMRGIGYGRFKLRVGFGPDDGLGVAESIASGLAAGEALMLDANQAWDLETARRSCARLAPLGLVWMEEPLPADAPLSDWQALARDAPMPLAAGENLGTEAAFDAVIAARCLGFLQPDICKWGGLSATTAIARKAQAAGITYCPHFLGGGVGLVASAHLLAAVGGKGFLEVDSSENPLLEVFSGRGLALEAGLFPISDAPGLGYDPDIATMSDLLVSRQEVRA